MNEHMQELISAYLHRGSTPEQEKELFEACKNDPATAEHLRQHLILSLKLRGLRDDVTVSSELRSSLERRIDATDVHEDQEENVQAAVPVPETGGFRLAHLFGTGIATATAAVVLMLLMRSDPDMGPAPETAQLGTTADTVFMVQRDTIRQIHEVEKPVYIVKQVPVQPDESNPVLPPSQEQIAEHRDLRNGTEAEESPVNRAASETDILPVSTESSVTADDEQTAPLFVDARPVEPVSTEAKTQNYLDQYNAMLVSVESVQLTSQDRISN